MTTVQLIGMIAGHLSFGMTAIAYSMRKIVWLRIIGIVSLTLGLVYNATLASGPLWLVLFWLCVFMAIHVIRVVGEIRRNIEVPLCARQRRLMAEAFPTMHSADFKRLWDAAAQCVHAPHETMLRVGDETAAVTMICDGYAIENRQDGRSIRRAPGLFWGELTYMLGTEEFNSSPCSIAAASEGCSTLSWDYDLLHELCAKSDRLKAALYEGFVRSAGIKHGLLIHDWFTPPHTSKAA